MAKKILTIIKKPKKVLTLTKKPVVPVDNRRVSPKKMAIGGFGTNFI